MHSAHDDDLCVGLCCFTSESERIAYEVSHFLYFSYGIIMGEYYGILFFAHTSDLGFEISTLCYGLVDVAQFFPFVVHICYLFDFGLILQKY